MHTIKKQVFVKAENAKRGMFISPLEGVIDLSCCCQNTRSLCRYSCLDNKWIHKKWLESLSWAFAIIWMSVCIQPTKFISPISKGIFLRLGGFCLWGVTYLKQCPCWAVLHSEIPSSITFSGTLTRLLSIFYGCVSLGRRTPWFRPCGDRTL